MKDPVEEWLKQADYDFESAEYNFKGKRYLHAVFMAHLAVEKALKARFQQVHQKYPTKTHNLVYLGQQTGDDYPEEVKELFASLSKAQVETRYPDEIDKIRKQYDRKTTAALLERCREARKWMKAKF